MQRRRAQEAGKGWGRDPKARAAMAELEPIEKTTCLWARVAPVVVLVLALVAVWPKAHQSGRFPRCLPSAAFDPLVPDHRPQPDAGLDYPKAINFQTELGRSRRLIVDAPELGAGRALPGRECRGYSPVAVPGQHPGAFPTHATAILPGVAGKALENLCGGRGAQVGLTSQLTTRLNRMGVAI